MDTLRAKWLGVALAWLAGTLAVSAGPRLHQIQVVGTHNSYHVAPHPAVEALIRQASPGEVDGLLYTHRPLEAQLESLGIRQVELDLYADPDGGLFAEPAGLRAVEAAGAGPLPRPDPEVMRRPGTKILHVPDVDFQTTVPSLRQALEAMNRWSTRHPAHVPVMVLLELKSEVAREGLTRPLPWTAERMAALEREVLEILPPARLIRPDDVRRGHASPREAVLAQGWPELGDLRGRFLFALDNTDAVRDVYLAPDPALRGRAFFVSVDEAHPAAAWFKINDPIADGERIRRLVKAGFLVRTRADTDTREARLRDTRRREAALDSGAQFVSTDYPEPHLPWGDYAVRWSGGVVARPNPVSAPGVDPGLDLEALAPPGLEPFGREELLHLNRRARASHLLRRLGEASRDYARLLELDPVRVPTDGERALALRHAPLLRIHAEDPFPLRDVVAVIEPGGCRIGYHLFWEDDIDFPEDNDPADHEIVWVELDAPHGAVRTVFTYFHGTLLKAPAVESPPGVAVEWGKHGSLPWGAEHRPAVEPAAWRRNWEALHGRGIRLPGHPLAAGWPKRFQGTWEDYRRFDARVSTRERLERGGRIWVSPWANAVLDQHALPYNFAPKNDWPD